MSTDLIAPSVQQLVLESEFERTRRITRAWEYYLATAALPLTVSPDADDNVRINLAKALVTKGVAWLFGADRGLGFAVEDDQAATDKLDEVWPVDRRALTLNHLGLNGGVTGHTFARLHEDSRVTVWDPSNAVVHWDDEDYELVIEFQNIWTAIDSNGDPYARRQRVIRGDAGTTWVIIDEKSTTSGGGWEELNRDTWQHEWAPIFHAQNLPMPNEFWGEADLETDVLDLIDSIQAVAGYARKIVRHRGHPLPYATGEKAEKIEELNVSLGRFLAFPNEKAQVGQLEAADLGGAVTLYEKLWEAWHYVTRTPAAAFGVVMANIAEETVEFAYSSAVEKTWDKRLTIGPMLTELAGRILELNGTADTRPQPQWGQIIPRSPKSEAEGLEADQRMGIVSRKTLAQRRGYDWEVEEPLLAEERARAAEEMARAFDAGAGGEEDEGEDEE